MAIQNNLQTLEEILYIFCSVKHSFSVYNNILGEDREI